MCFGKKYGSGREQILSNQITLSKIWISYLKTTLYLVYELSFLNPQFQRTHCPIILFLCPLGSFILAISIPLSFSQALRTPLYHGPTENILGWYVFLNFFVTPDELQNNSLSQGPHSHHARLRPIFVNCKQGWNNPSTETDKIPTFWTP